MVKDPVCGMEVDEKKTKYKNGAHGKDILLLLLNVHGNIPERST